MTFRPVGPILATLLVGAGCAGQPDEIASGLGVSRADSSGIEVVTIDGSVGDLPVWALDTTASWVISGDAPPYLGSVGEVSFLSDGSLLVEDNQTSELRRFGPDGSHSLIGGRGEGPGEFQGITTLSVTPGDTFFVFDLRVDRVSAFLPDGGLITTFTLPGEDGGLGTIPLDAWGLDGDHIAVYRLGPYDAANPAPHPRRDQRDAVVNLLDGAGGPRGPRLTFRGGYSAEFEFGDGRAPFSNRPAVAVRSGRLAYTSGLTYEIVVTDRNLVPSRVIRWPGWSRPLTPESIQETRDSMDVALAPMRAARPDLAEGFMDATFSPNVLPDTLPALGELVLEDDRTLWVSRFEPTTVPWQQTDLWHVLDPSGQPLARVALPPHARLVAASRDRVALVMRDELEVEHVRVFRLLRGR